MAARWRHPVCSVIDIHIAGERCPLSPSLKGSDRAAGVHSGQCLAGVRSRHCRPPRGTPVAVPHTSSAEGSVKSLAPLTIAIIRPSAKHLASWQSRAEVRLPHAWFDGPALKDGREALLDDCQQF